MDNRSVPSGGPSEEFTKAESVVRKPPQGKALLGAAGEGDSLFEVNCRKNWMGGKNDPKNFWGRNGKREKTRGVDSTYKAVGGTTI